MRIINLFRRIFLNLILSNRSTFRAVLAVILLSMVSPLHSAEEQADKSSKVGGDVKIGTRNKAGRDKGTPTVPQTFKRIKEEGGTVIIDGPLMVLEQTNVKTFDMVEISTPVTPATNHVRLFAVAIGTYTAIKALFDDGTFKVIGNN